MKRIAWRPLLLAICALAALVQVAGVLDATGIAGAPPWLGWVGANSGPSSRPFNLAVTSVEPGSPAARAGLRRCDLIDFRANTLTERYSLFQAPLNGRPLALLVHRGALQEKLTVVPRALKPTWNLVAQHVCGSLASVVCSADCMAPLRRAAVAAAVVVTRGLCPYGRPNQFCRPLGVAGCSLKHLLKRSCTVVGGIAGGICKRLRPTDLAASSYHTMAMLRIPRDPHRDLFSWDDRSDHDAVRPVLFVGGVAGLFTAAAAVLMAVLCGLRAIAASRGAERQRAVWTLVLSRPFFVFSSHS